MLFKNNINLPNKVNLPSLKHTQEMSKYLYVSTHGSKIGNKIVQLVLLSQLLL